MQLNLGEKIKNILVTAMVMWSTLIVATLAYSPVAYAFGVGIQPSTVEMTVKPGDRHRQVITVGNVHKTKTISMTMGLADWTLDKTGQLTLSPPGETERSAALWIRFSPASVTLKPETSQDIIVEISVPYKTEARGDHRFALLATTLLPELDERGDISGVWNRYQLASLFYLTLTPSSSTPKVLSVAFDTEAKDTLTLSIKNDGDAHARLKGTAFIKDAAGETVAQTTLSTVVLDRGEREYKVKFDNLDMLTTGEKYKIDFDLKNSFAPQNRFKAMDVDVQPFDFHAP